MVERQPLVSLVFVTFNGIDDFKECLNSLAEQTYKNFEIIVVDNGSDSSMLSFLESITKDIRLVKTGKNNGFGRGNNIGIKECAGELVVFTNYDAVFDKDWLAQLVTTALSSEDIGIVAPKILFYKEREYVNTLGVFFSYLGYACADGINEHSNLHTTRRVIASASGCCFLIKKSLLEVIGGFDEEFHNFGNQFFFSSLEDIDLCWRVHINGKKVLLEPNALMYHKYIQKPLQEIRYLYLECGRYYTLLKNYRLITIVLLLPVLLLFECMTWAFALVKGKNYLFKKFSSYLIIAQKITILKQKRTEIAKLRAVPDADILEVLGTNIHLRHLPIPSYVKQIIEFGINTVFNVYKLLVVKILSRIEKGTNKRL